MAIRATYVASGLPGTDITIGPLIDPTSKAVIDEVYQGCRAGVLECREHDRDQRLAHLRDPDDGRVHGAWVCVKQNPARTKWFLAHLPSGVARGFDDHVVHANKSDQHQWQQDYYQRAAEDAGWQVQQEVPIPGTQLDVCIAGSVGRVAIEVQHSHLSVPKVRLRDRKAVEAGIIPFWSADKRAPDWAFKVAHVETNELPHGYAPRGSWTAIGPRRVVPARCSPANFERCWQPRKRTFCGGWHARFVPMRGLCVDDLAAKVPAGELVRLDTRVKQGVILVPAQDRDLWLSDFAAQVAWRATDRERNQARRCSYERLADQLIAETDRPAGPYPKVPPRICEGCGVPKWGLADGHCMSCRARLRMGAWGGAGR